MSKSRILVADDHELLRRGLIATLEQEPDLVVVGQAANGRQAVDLFKTHRPEVVVLDISMPELNGLEAARQILQLEPHTRILVLTMHDSEQVVREVLDAGAQGYLLKSDAGTDLVSAIKALLQEKPFFTSKVAKLVIQGYLTGRPAPATGSQETPLLSGREREIVQLLAEGASNKEVAATLGISTKTAETHRTNIMRKMGFRSITDIVRYAIRNKMVQP